jgi:hypothetical protein
MGKVIAAPDYENAANKFVARFGYIRGFNTNHIKGG